MLDMLIQGGRVVTPAGVGDWDVGIVGEQIVAVAFPGILPTTAKQVIDARGKVVVPGGIETHAHAVANVQPGARTLVAGVPNAGPLEHSLGAIWGGTTTVVDFAPVPTAGDLDQGIHDYLTPWQGNAYTDYSTHCIYTSRNPPDTIARYHELVSAGFPSVKIFTTDIRPPEGRQTSLTPIGKIDTGRLEDLMRQIARHGGVLAVHGEDDELVMDKLAGRNVVDVRGGNIGIEIRMGVNYTEAVVRRGMALEDYAAVTSTNAAKLLGLYPRKGAIAIGSDADITIIDPAVKKTLSMADLHLRDYSPWEGWEVKGWPTTVILRGKVMVENGRLLGAPTDGQLNPRKIDPGVLRRPAF